MRRRSDGTTRSPTQARSAATAIAKLAGQDVQVQTAEKLRIPWARYRLIAVPEAAAAVGLLAGYASAPLGQPRPSVSPC